jgi:hypothetical protein
MRVIREEFLLFFKRSTIFTSNKALTCGPSYQFCLLLHGYQFCFKQG